MKLFMYKLALKPKYHDFANWDQGVQDIFKAHAAHLEQLIAKGVAVMVGRTDTELKDNMGLVLLTAENLAAAQKVADADPVVKDGLMTVAVYPFKMLAVTDAAKTWSSWS